jgi:AcrR family transcriptional regulator
MNSAKRLRSEERRAAIVEAVIPVFAKNGFHGTTTKDLAEAAGVSEALLYRHFPSKESLYEEIQIKSCALPELDPLFDQFKIIPPSSEKLVFMIHLLMHRIVIEQDLSLPRLMASSLLDDGQFATLFLENFRGQFLELFLESLEAAKAVGDVSEMPVDDALRLWLCHHLAASLLFVRLPGKSAIDYGLSREKLVVQAVRFCLRGMGFKDEAIDRHYDPETIGEIVDEENE